MPYWLDDDQVDDTPDDTPDRDDFGPGGPRFDEADTPSLEDHPMYEHFNRGAAEY